MFVVVVEFDGENRITKFKDGFATIEDAQSFVEGLDSDLFPNAFAAEQPTSGSDREWLVDFPSKTLSYAENPEDAQNAIKQKMALLEAEITPRRLREYNLNEENPPGWYAAQNEKIKEERKKLQ